MHTLLIDATWATQIKQIRDAATDPTPLMRPDGSAYRICRRGDATFKVQLLPSFGRPGKVELVLRESDLYVTHVDGREFDTYDATLDTQASSAEALNAAVMGLRVDSGRSLFRKQSLIVLCVAESLRNDRAAATIEAYIRMLSTGVGDALGHLPVGELLREAHAWGQTCDAVFAALTPAARVAVLAWHTHHGGPIAVPRIERELQPWLPNVRVLKRPG
jgi:hypothetical protein